MKYYIITGKSSSGKDEFINFVKLNTNENVFNLTTIAPITLVAERLKSAPIERNNKNDREFLHQLKKLASIHFNTSLNYIDYSINKIKEDYGDDGLVFIHSREPIEQEKLKELYGAKLIMVHDVSNSETKESPSLLKLIKDSKIDIHIHNDKSKGLDYLNLLSQIFLKGI